MKKEKKKVLYALLTASEFFFLLLLFETWTNSLSPTYNYQFRRPREEEEELSEDDEDSEIMDNVAELSRYHRTNRFREAIE